MFIRHNLILLYIYFCISFFPSSNEMLLYKQNLLFIFIPISNISYPFPFFHFFLVFFGGLGGLGGLKINPVYKRNATFCFSTGVF